MNPTPSRTLATWATARPWLLGLGIALAGTLLTALGSAIAVATHLSDVSATWTIAAAVTASALVGLGWMRWSGHALSDYGFRHPSTWGGGLTLLGMAALPIIVLVEAAGIHVTAAQALAYLALCVAVGFNEEIYFRGLLMAALRSRGHRTAVVGSAVFFGVLHLANAASGASPAYLVAQLVFAFLVGLVLAMIVTHTGSLWPCILWHAAYDMGAYCTGNALTMSSAIALGLCDVILVAIALVLWQRLPRRADAAA